MTIKVDIISGFLGSGKTTFIKKMIKESENDSRIVVIENEFGEIGIDTDILRNSGIKIKEIISGCICCSMIGEFKDAIVEVIEKFSPNHIIIEPSGVGKTSEIINSCLSCEADIYINNIITIIDPIKYFIHIKNFKDFYLDQINCANIIVLSRTQQLENTKIEDVVEDLKKHNTISNIHVLPWSELNIKSFGHIGNNYSRLIKEIKHCDNHNEIKFESFCYTYNNKYTSIELRNKLTTLSNASKYGNIIRVKGILNSTEGNNIKVDFVSNEINIEKIEYDGIGRICFIGYNLSRENIIALMKLRA